MDAEQTHFLPGLDCSFQQQFMEHIPTQVVGAGTGDKITALVKQFHAPAIYGQIPLQTFLDKLSAFYEGRRIEHDNVKAAPFTLQTPQPVKGIFRFATHSG
jgi:hypothetical protein